MARLLLSIAQHGLQLCFQIRSEVCASVWSSAICYGSATCRLQSETKQRTRVYAGLCGRCGWMCWEGEVVRLELGLRMLYLISQCRRRSGGRCRRRAKTSSYLVPSPPSCASMVGLFVLPVATTRPAACDMCTTTLTSPSVLVEAQLFHSYKQNSQRPCMR